MSFLSAFRVFLASGSEGGVGGSPGGSRDVGVPGSSGGSPGVLGDASLSGVTPAPGSPGATGRPDVLGSPGVVVDTRAGGDGSDPGCADVPPADADTVSTSNKCSPALFD